jgi:predicted nucleic acid-binding protein
MSRIYWDTMLFIYMLEGNAEFGPRVRQIHREMTKRGDTLCTSVFTLGEVLILPQRTGASHAIAQVKNYFEHGEVELIPFNVRTAEAYAQIRAESSVLPADAIHLASAAEARANLFLTNDRKLQRLRVPGIQFIAGLDGVIF